MTNQPPRKPRRKPTKMTPLDQPKKYTPVEIEWLRERVETLAKLDVQSSWKSGITITMQGPSCNEPQVDPLLVERQLLTYVINGTTAAELDTRIENKRAEKEAEEEANLKTREKENWTRGEQELLHNILSLEDLIKFAEGHKDGPRKIDPFARPNYDQKWQWIKRSINQRLEDMDKWDHVPAEEYKL